MSKFLISFGANAMSDIPDEDFPAVADAAHAVVQEIVNAGAYVLAGGLDNESADVVAVDGTVRDGRELATFGGVTIVEVPSREEALFWAGKIAAACRCAQEVWELRPDPKLEAMFR